MDINDFDYELPNELIAQSFVEPRDHSNLFVLGDKFEHKKFYDVVDYFKKGDVLVVNDTKVLNSKIHGAKPTGAKGEFIIERKVKDNVYKSRIKGGHPRLGNVYVFEEGKEGKIIFHDADTFLVEYNFDIEKYLSENGLLPLPSYVRNEIENQNRYQTTYAKDGNSLAAPTAGLHFTDELLEKLKEIGVKIAKVRLDISFETFFKVTNEHLKNKKLHKETIIVSQETADIINNRKGRLVVCGTTSLRTLESVADDSGKIIPQEKITDIFIYPGVKLKIVPEIIITNFHLPKSSLFMMISAYVGKDTLMKAYQKAIKKKYRFYSLGDSMLILNSHPQ